MHIYRKIENFSPIGISMKEKEEYIFGMLFLKRLSDKYDQDKDAR